MKKANSKNSTFAKVMAAVMAGLMIFSVVAIALIYILQ